jgi:hypothetical protein
VGNTTIVLSILQSIIAGLKVAATQNVRFNVITDDKHGFVMTT